MAQLTEQKKKVLAYTLLGEAAGEGKEGMKAVAWVLRNRAESGRYPSDPAAVALQQNRRGVHQFSTWNGDPITKFGKSAQLGTALSVIDEVFGDENAADPTRGAMNYYASDGANAIKTPYWFDKEASGGAVQIGNHRFAAKVAQDAALSVTPVLGWHETARGNRGYVKGSETHISGAVIPAAASAAAQQEVAGGLDSMAYRVPLATPNPHLATAQDEAARLSVPLPKPAGSWVTAAPALTSHSVHTVAIGPDGNPVSAASQTQLAANREAARLAQERAQRDDVFAEMKQVKAYNRVQQTQGSWKTSGTTTVHADGTVTTRAPIAGSVQMAPGARPSNIDHEYQVMNNPPAPKAPAAPAIPGPNWAPKSQEQLITKEITLQQPTYITTYTTETRKIPISGTPQAIEKLQDIHDRNDAATMKAQTSAPQFKTITVQVPHTTKVMKPVMKTIQVKAPIAVRPLTSSSQRQQVEAPRPAPVRLASGTTSYAGATGSAQGGRYSYQVQANGSVVNTTTGRTTSPATGYRDPTQGHEGQGWHDPFK